MSARSVTFRADDEILAALATLEARVSAGVVRRVGRRGARSVAIREAILKAARDGNEVPLPAVEIARQRKTKSDKALKGSIP